MPIAPLFPLATRAAALPTQAWPEQAPAYDPMAGIVPLRPRQRNRQPPVTITPEEERSLGRDIMGGVQWVGESADKLGAASRGILGGITDIAQGRAPDFGGGLLNLIPFSDTLGITDPEQRVSEWTLGEKLGMPENQPGLDPWDVAKFGLGVVTDPLFWATGPLGTLTKTGAKAAKAAKAAELTRLGKPAAKTITEAVAAIDDPAKAFAAAGKQGLAAAPVGTPGAAAAIEQIRRGDMALFGFRRPTIKPRLFPIGMTDEAVLSFGTGEWAAKTAEALFYGGGGPLSLALSPLRKVIQAYRGTFTPHMLGQYTAVAQRAADVGIAEMRLASDAATELFPHVARLDELVGKRYADEAAAHLKNSPLTGEQAYNDFMRMAAEQPEFAAGITPELARLQEIAAKTLGSPQNTTLPQLVGANNELSTGINKLLDTLQLKTEIPAYRDLMDLGLDTKILDDIYAFHFSRRPGNVKILKEPGKDVSSAFFQFSLARQGPLRDLPFGSWFINNLARDSVYRGLRASDEAIEASTVGTAKKGLMVGQPVHALDPKDGGGPWDNYGWVWDVKGGKARVHFESPEGAVTEKWIDEDFLVATQNAVKKPPPRFVQRMTAEEHSTALRNALASAGVDAPKKASLKTLRKMYLESQHVRPALDEVWADPNAVRAWQTGDPLDRAEEYSRWFDDTVQARDANKNLQFVKDADGKAVPKMVPNKRRLDEIDDYFSKLPEQTVAKGLFDRSVVDDWKDYMESIIDAQSSLRSAHAMFSTPGALVKATNAPGEIPLETAWKAAGFTDRGLATLANKLAPGADVAQWSKDMAVTPAAYKALKAFGGALNPKEASGPVWQTWDKVMAYYKGHLTLPFANFHGRNDISNIWLAYTEGRVGLGAIAKGHWNFFKYAIGKGKVPDDVAELIREGIENGAITTHKGVAMDISGHAVPEHIAPGFANLKNIASKLTPSGRKAGREARGWSPELYEARPTANKVMDFLFGTRRQVPEELAAQGVQAMPVSPLMDVGETMYQLIEGKGRGGYYIALRKAGYKASEAKHLVDRALYDYTNLSKADKALRRAVPFWMWRKNNIPAQLRKLFDKPAEQVATLRTINAIQNQDEYTPQWLRESLGVPLPEWLGGKAPEGGRNYLHSLGLPIEDLNVLALEKGGKVSRRTAEKLLSGLAPPITAGIESFTGKQLFTGRELKDLEPLFGTHKLDRLAFALAHSPVSRYATEFRKLGDYQGTRALWEAAGLPDPEAMGVRGAKSGAASLANILTGIKSTTVEDLEKAKAIDLRRLIQGQVAASPYSRTYEQIYVPQRYQDEGLGMEEAAQIRRANQLTQLLKQMRERAEAKEASGG